tara:strand:+ start:355 stop:936 length:582 start_codon:yes stop_codon:yes gene_type:complete
MKSTIYTLRTRRKRRGLTNPKKRLRMLSSKKPMLVIRKSLNNIQASIVEYGKKGDIVKVCSHSNNLKKLGWHYNTANMPAAYLVGYSLGKKAKKANLNEAIVDLGFQKSIKGCKIYAVLAGAVDAGLSIPHKKEVLPPKERILGTHIANYAKELKKQPELLKKRFGNYLKNNHDPENISKKFEEVKGNIEKNV